MPFRSLALSAAIALAILTALSCGCGKTGETQSPTHIIRVSSLSPLPDSLGFGGPFAGVSHGALIVAGGANFNESAWGKGEKKWHDDIFVLEQATGAWRNGFFLPAPRAYGVSATYGDGIIMAGGSDAENAHDEVYYVRWTGNDIAVTNLPPLPEPRAAMTGGILGGALYIACGQTASAETEVTATLFRLSLPGDPSSQAAWKDVKWERMEPLPGMPRAQAAGCVQDGALYVVSGFTLAGDGNGSPKRKYLRDAWRYTPGSGWKRIADVPCGGTVAAPCAPLGETHVIVFGGHDGSGDDRVSELGERWPGFSCDILAYHTITGTWVRLGGMAYGAVTTTAVPWNGGIVIPSGEIRPRIRTNHVTSYGFEQKKRAFGTLNTLLLGIYLAALVWMGFYFSRREKTTLDFFIGGRRIPWWAVGLSIFGTQLSSISFMAIPAKVYATDWTYYIGFLTIVLIQPVVVWCYLPFFRRFNMISAYEYLERRFSPAVSLFGSLSFVLFQVGRMAIVLFLPALALSAVTGIDISVSIVVMGLLATVYTVLGGIEAVVWTDVLQVIVLVGGALVSLVIIIAGIDGGIGTIVRTAVGDGKLRLVMPGWDHTAPVLWIIFIGGLFQNIATYSSDQAIVQRYLTTKDEKSAARAIWTNAVMILPSALIWFSLGTALYVFYKFHPSLLDPALKTDQIFPLFIAQQLPDGVVGLVIAGLFAATMSTVDSSLNSSSTVIVNDFYRRFKPDATDHGALVLARAITVLLGTAVTVAGLWMASNRDMAASLWDIYMSVLGLLMGSLAGLFALGIFTRRANGKGALVGAFAGAATLYWVQNYTRLHFYIYAAVGVTACFAAGYVASLIIPSRKPVDDDLTIYGIHGRRADKDNPPAGT